MPERTCPNCGTTVEDAKYCPECGEPLTGPAESKPEAGKEEAPGMPGPPPPPPPEERPLEEEPPEVAGAEESGPDLPPSEPPTAAEPFDAPTARRAGEASEAEGPVTPEDLEPRGPHDDPVVAGATPMQQAAEDARAPAAPVDGQLRCPSCGESVYEADRVCWSCSRRLEPAAVEEPAEPPPRTPEEGAEPASGAPAAVPAPARETQAAPRHAPSAATRQREEDGGEPSGDVMSYAWWSFGLGLLSVFTCGILGLLGIASLWLGISAARRNAGPVAIAGAVFGVIGILMLLAWVIALAIMMPEMMRNGPTHIMLPTFF